MRSELCICDAGKITRDNLELELLLHDQFIKVTLLLVAYHGSYLNESERVDS